MPTLRADCTDEEVRDEIRVIADIKSAIDKLPRPAVRRVMRWVEAYGRDRHPRMLQAELAALKDQQETDQ